MRLEKIITMASADVRLPFLAMERSLRTAGCDLPLWVIPYDDSRFELPDGARWWVVPAVIEWLAAERAHPLLRKYQALTEGGYHFTDVDVVFLRDPQAVLAPYDGIITACTEWNKPEHTHTYKSRLLMARESSTWQKRVFNSGQFACDRRFFPDFATLKAAASRPDFRKTCLRLAADQPGINLLALHARLPVTNLTLPPHQMESTWAGDYPGEYESLWTGSDRMPMLIHWAGSVLERDLPINDLFLRQLTPVERAEWTARIARARAGRRARAGWPLPVRTFNRILRRVYRRYRVYRVW